MFAAVVLPLGKRSHGMDAMSGRAAMQHWSPMSDGGDIALLENALNAVGYSWCCIALVVYWLGVMCSKLQANIQERAVQGVSDGLESSMLLCMAAMYGM